MNEQNKRLSVDPATYGRLLHTIAKAESNDNYNAYFGKPANTDIDFTNMTVRQVLAWQHEFIKQGNPSSAVGRYQIVNTTLIHLVDERNIDVNRKFDRLLQDELAIALLERRGSEKYVNKEITKEQFAANLAMEWAALPKVIGANPNASYYAGDGLNASRLNVADILSAIAPISPK